MIAHPHSVVLCIYVSSVVSDSWRSHGLKPVRLLCPWDSPGKSPGVGCHFLLQGIFLTQGFESGSLASPALAGRLFTTVPPKAVTKWNEPYVWDWKDHQAIVFTYFKKWCLNVKPSLRLSLRKRWDYSCGAHTGQRASGLNGIGASHQGVHLRIMYYYSNLCKL